MSEQQTPMRSWKRHAILAVAILLGVAIFFSASLLKRPPKQNPIAEQAVKVRAIKVPSLDVVPRTYGYGRVAPARNWEAVSEVSGQVVWIADELRDGRVVTAGTELLRIEDANYQLIQAQTEAQLQAAEAKRKSAQKALALAKQNLTLLQKDYKRQQQLAAKGTISKTTLESTERQVLVGRTQVDTHQSSLNLLNAENQALLAQRDAAVLDLQRTTITAPFDVRITRVNIGTDQYANKGQLLFTGDGLEVAEVEAQFSVGILRPLIRGITTESETPVRAGAMGLNALVRLQTASHTVEWSARVDRVAGTIDPQTQTLGVIVAVDRPYASAVPGERPPLMRDTFVEVELYSKPIKQRVVIPRSALHDGSVYVVNKESRLEKRKVTLDFAQQGYVVIAMGLEAGERIVTSDLLTATEGMLLALIEDKKAKRQMIVAATGKEPKQ